MPAFVFFSLSFFPSHSPAGLFLSLPPVDAHELEIAACLSHSCQQQDGEPLQPSSSSAGNRGGKKLPGTILSLIDSWKSQNCRMTKHRWRRKPEGGFPLSFSWDFKMGKTCSILLIWKSYYQLHWLQNCSSRFVKGFWTSLAPCL